MFWMVLRPRLITSLRHVWTHPDLPDEPGVAAEQDAPDKVASEKWLRHFCATADCPSYEAVIGRLIDEDVDGEEYLHFGTDAHGEIPAEFWKHVEIVTGRKFSNPPTYFSCAC